MAGAHFRGMEFGRLLSDPGGPLQWQFG
jgi:hypothetical protein